VRGWLACLRERGGGLDPAALRVLLR